MNQYSSRTNQNEPEKCQTDSFICIFTLQSVALQISAFTGLENVREGSRYRFSLPDLWLSAEFYQYETFVVFS